MQGIERLELKWSPEQISNRLRVDGEETFSAETTYKFVYEDGENGGELWSEWGTKVQKEAFFRWRSSWKDLKCAFHFEASNQSDRQPIHQTQRVNELQFEISTGVSFERKVPTALGIHISSLGKAIY